jgi:hypothetical protein
LHRVEIPVDVKLQKNRRVIGGPTRGLWIDTGKAKLAKVKRIDKGIDDLITRIFLLSLHPFPKVLRIERVKVGKRNDGVCFRLATAKYHIAMEIVALGIRRPLEPDQRGNQPWLIMFFRGCGYARPR